MSSLGPAWTPGNDEADAERVRISVAAELLEIQDIVRSWPPARKQAWITWASARLRVYVQENETALSIGATTVCHLASCQGRHEKHYMRWLVVTAPLAPWCWHQPVLLSSLPSKRGGHLVSWAPIVCQRLQLQTRHLCSGCDDQKKLAATTRGPFRHLTPLPRVPLSQQFWFWVCWAGFLDRGAFVGSGISTLFWPRRPVLTPSSGSLFYLMQMGSPFPASGFSLFRATLLSPPHASPSQDPA